jgi:hypothetical protein
MSTSPEQITLTREQKERLARIADATGKPWDEVLAEALAAYRPGSHTERTNGQESFYEAATRLGLIGCVKSGPPDLSTNPKYMEGFGQRDT